MRGRGDGTSPAQEEQTLPNIHELLGGKGVCQRNPGPTDGAPEESPMDTWTPLPSFLIITCLLLQVMINAKPADHLNDRIPRGLIRPLSCHDNKTGETGICMFALTCYQMNGTPLTTCRDGIFLGSCCRLQTTTERPSTEIAETISELTGNDLPANTSPEASSWEWTYHPPTLPTHQVTSVVTSVNVGKLTTKPTTSVTALPPKPPTSSSHTPSLSDSNLLIEIVSMLQGNGSVASTPIQGTSITTPETSTVPLVTRKPITSTPTPIRPSTLFPLDWEIISETTKNLTKTTVRPLTTTTRPYTYRPIYHTPPPRPSITSPTTIITKPTKRPPTIPFVYTTVRTTSTSTSTSTVSASSLPTSPSTTTEFDLSNADYKEACGRTFYNSILPRGRIVGGNKSEFGKWPWQVSLRQWKKNAFQHKCGAALLNENWAITAAHCVDNVPVEQLQVRIGEFDVRGQTEPLPHVDRQVQIIAKHPDFDARNFENDLALVRFYEPTRFQKNIVPICIPQDDNSFVNDTAYVTGWGRLYEDGPLPDQLYEAQIPIISNLECEKLYRLAGYVESIPDIFICAGRPGGGVDSCEGDSGGPMVIRGPNKRWMLAGIISWGIGCAEPNQPGVYTRISRFRDWINAILVF